ncbi:MAG TPA: pirin family protein [Fredinandcohnia sp.]|nr:pirin family protein [Fredinandcohnia sp.]
MSEAVELVLEARPALLPGGLSVRRALPRAKRRMVGPFVFVDQMGPAAISSGASVDVLSHPHIGLSTLTWLFEGEGLHKDSLGYVQPIRPGEVNWMTAGKGIVHAEFMRGGDAGRLFGVQTWVALPRAEEERDPSFEHYGADQVPTLDAPGVRMKLIAGELFGARSGVRVFSPLFYLEARMEAGAQLDLPADHPERALYLVEGAVSAAGRILAPGELAVFAAGPMIRIEAAAPSLLLLLGGEPLDGPRFIEWNFVSSSKERIARAVDDWRHQRFSRIPGETAYIPLPRDGSEPVNYP